VKIVVDTSLAPRIARILESALAPTHNVVHANDISGRSNSDAEVCSYVKANVPSVIIMQDLDTSGQPHRMTAIGELETNVIMLAHAWLKIRPDEHAWMLLKVIPRALKRIEEASGTAMLQITPGPQPHIRKLK